MTIDFKKKTHAVFLSVLHVEPKASASVPVPGVTPVAMKHLRYQLIIRAYKLRGKTRLARDPQSPTLWQCHFSSPNQTIFLRHIVLYDIPGRDDEMTEDGDSEEEDEGESDNQLSDDGNEQEEEAAEVADGSVIPFPAEQLIDDEIADEMGEFGYTGLDQILWDYEEDEDEDKPGGYEGTLGTEDGEGVSNEGEEVGFADL